MLPSKAKFNNYMFLTSIFLVRMNAAGELKPGQQQFPLTSQGWTLGAGFSVVTSLSWPGEPENCKNSNKIASKRKRRHFNWSRVPGRRKCKKCYKAEHNAHCDNIVPHPGVTTLTSVTVSQQHPLCTDCWDITSGHGPAADWTCSNLMLTLN